MRRLEITLKASTLSVVSVSVSLSVLLALLVASAEDLTALQEHQKFQQVTINGHIFKLELALNEGTRRPGLSGRSAVDPDGGMLFVYPEPRVRRYWMKDCLVPLDVIFLDAEGRIASMHAMQVEPEKTRSYPARLYGSEKPVQFVLELAGGTLEQLELRKGQRIDLPYDVFRRYAR